MAEAFITQKKVAGDFLDLNIVHVTYGVQLQIASMYFLWMNTECVPCTCSHNIAVKYGAPLLKASM